MKLRNKHRIQYQKSIYGWFSPCCHKNVTDLSKDCKTVPEKYQKN